MTGRAAGPGQASTAHVEFDAVGKSYDGKTTVVHRLDLAVRRGELLTLLGPSGSGKTTCLMMLAGFETPTTGAIRIDGRDVSHTPPRKRDIGFVFQNYALFPHPTVAGNLRFPLRVRGIKGSEQTRRVRDAVRIARIDGLEERTPAELSGGQQQRVAIARALVFEPSLVLMDEPLGALDRRLREEMQFEIRSIQQSVGGTVVYVTHDQQEAMAISDRVAVFRGGRIEQIASPETLYEEPEREFVARFIGDNNLLRGRLAEVDGDICRVQTPGGLVTAFRVAEQPVGSDAVLAIRPERVALAPAEGAYRNRFEADVLSVNFMGDHLRVRLHVCGSSSFWAKIPNIVGHGAVLKGDRVAVGWGVTDCRALPDEQAAPLA